MNCKCREEAIVIDSSTLLSLSRASYELRKLAFCFWTIWTVPESVEHGNNWYFHLCCVTRKRATRCLGKLVSFIVVTSPRNGCGVALDAAGTKRWPHWSHKVSITALRAGTSSQGPACFLYSLCAWQSPWPLAIHFFFFLNEISWVLAKGPFLRAAVDSRNVYFCFFFF